jgi:hypothetical protein
LNGGLILGQSVQAMNSEFENILIENLPDGLYIIQVKSNIGIHQKKLQVLKL